MQSYTTMGYIQWVIKRSFEYKDFFSFLCVCIDPKREKCLRVLCHFIVLAVGGHFVWALEEMTVAAYRPDACHWQKLHQDNTLSRWGERKPGRLPKKYNKKTLKCTHIHRSFTCTLICSISLKEKKPGCMRTSAIYLLQSWWPDSNPSQQLCEVY